MRTPHVLVPRPLDGLDVGATVALPEDRVHHLRRVLRRDDGAALEITDGTGLVAPARLVGDHVQVTDALRAVAAPVPAITVLHAVPKGRALDEIVRTLAELGVTRVLPVLTDHTEARPTGDRALAVGDRLRAVAASALQQAHSAHLCEVGDPADLALTLRDLPRAPTRLAAHPGAEVTLGARLATAPPDAAIQLLIGPEGGLSEREVADLVAGGWTPVLAGDTVLRTVHAATVLVAAVLALTGRFGAAGP